MNRIRILARFLQTRFRPPSLFGCGGVTPLKAGKNVLFSGQCLARQTQRECRDNNRLVKELPSCAKSRHNYFPILTAHISGTPGIGGNVSQASAKIGNRTTARGPG